MIWKRTIQFALLYLGSLTLVTAQGTTATISGTVTDSTGGMLPGAAVVVTNQDTAVTRHLVTDDRGIYQAINVSLGKYEIEVSLPGFRTEVRSGITLTMGRNAVVDFQLGVGDITDRVTVTGEAPLVDRSGATVGGLLGEREIRELPLDGRSFVDLAILQPGVVANYQSPQAAFLGQGTKLSVGGARGSNNLFLLDGNDINDVNHSTPGNVAGVLLGVETIREFKVLMNNYDAEYGTRVGGVITAVTKSGTNRVHGSLYHFHRNSALDARNFFDPPDEIPPFRRNQFGFTLGGPLKTDRTFFFGGYEGLRDRLSTTSTQAVPSLSAREGLLPDRQNLGQFIDVGVAPEIKPYLELYPLPTGQEFGDGRAEWKGELKRVTDANYFVLRIDHNLSESDSFFARYTFDDSESLIPSPLPLLGTAFDSRNQYLTVEEKHFFSPALLNVVRLGFNRSVSRAFGRQLIDMPSTLDFLPGRPFATSGGITVGGLAGIAAGGIQPLANFYNLYELTDDVSYTKGRHTWKFGFQFKRIQYNGRQEFHRAGSYRFTNLETFLRGNSRSLFVQSPDSDGHRNWRQSLLGFYAQDEFQLRPTLRINTGLRYEFVTCPREKSGKAARLLDPLDPETTILGKDCFLPNVSMRNFGPRFGLAWDPFGSGKTSIRGGGGIFYEQITTLYYVRGAGFFNPPFGNWDFVTSPTCCDAQLAVLEGEPDPIIESTDVTNQPYMWHYNLMLQQQLLPNLVMSVGYLGSRGVNLFYARDVNMASPEILPDGRKFFPEGSTRRNPNFDAIENVTTGARSWYNAMIFSLEQRFAHGVQFQLSYTFSKSLDEASSEFGASFNNSPREPQDAHDIRANKGPSAFDQKHLFRSSFVYELPVGPGYKIGGQADSVFGKMLGGWHLNGILTVNSGYPIGVSTGINRARTGQEPGNDVDFRPDLVPGKSNNPKIGTVEQWLDPSSYMLQEAGFFGNLGRNAAVGPPLKKLDLSLVKDTYVAEGRYVQFRAEVFNVLNRANFGTPRRIVFLDDSGVPAGDFGRITTTNTPARQIQFALKFIF